MAIPELQDTSGRLTDCIYFGDPISANIGSGFVPTARTISTTLPMTGGGDLSANRTLAINNFAGSVAGAVPPSTGGVVTFLRADGSWATPPTFGAAAAGYAPASGGGAVNYLRADGTWAAPAGSTISGLTPGVVPVADTPSSIVDSGITQGTPFFSFKTDDDGAGTYGGIQMRYDGVDTMDLYTWLTVPFPAFGIRNLRLSSAGTGGINISGTTVTLNDSTLGQFRSLGRINFPFSDLTLSNGHNTGETAVATTVAFNRIIGPTAAFSVGGIGAGTDSGSVIVLYNSTDQPMTLVNEDLLTLDSCRILTMTDADVVLPANNSSAMFLYDEVIFRWVLINTNPAAHPPLTSGYLPYESASAEFADSTLFHDSANNRYGFATATPKATVDINGTWATRKYSQLLAAGLNSDIPAPSGGVMRVTGPASAFSVGGVAVPSGADGLRLTIHNTTVRAMTIVNEDASSTAAYRITTLTGANVVLPARTSIVDLVYDVTASRWILQSVGTVFGTSATTEVLFNSAGAIASDNGLTVTGTGTSKVLTLGTDVNLSRKSGRVLELGVPGATTAEYLLTGNSTRGGTDSNKMGGALRLGGGAGTGTAGGGNTILQTAFAGPFGNTQNGYTERLVIGAKQITLTESAATRVAGISIEPEEAAGGELYYTIFASDGTDHQMRRGRVDWAAVNKASTTTIVLGTPVETVSVSAGTLTVTVAAADITDAVEFSLDAVSSLTQTSLYAWVSMQHDGKGSVSIP